MKKLILFLLIAFSVNALAQSVNIQAPKYDTIQLGLSTAVHIIFESNIIKPHIGLGMKDEGGKAVTDILMEDPQGGPRLSLTAAIPDFETTNLYVETEDGHYNFILQYAKWPRQQLVPVSKSQAIVKKKRKRTTRLFEETDSTETASVKTKEVKVLESLAKEVASKSSTMDDIGEQTQKMEYYLNAIYVKDNYYFFRVVLKNKGAVKYDLGYEGFFIREKKTKGVNQTTQQVEDKGKDLLYTWNGNVKEIQRKQSVEKVYVFPKFTIEGDKHFSIEFWEEAGQRKVEIKVSSKALLNANPL